MALNELALFETAAQAKRNLKAAIARVSASLGNTPITEVLRSYVTSADLPQITVDVSARHFAEKAQTDYIRYVKSFAAFLGRSPDTASAEDLRLFQQHMTKTHVSPGVINATVVALRFFFKVTLERDDLVRRLTLVSEPRRVPIVLSPEEVARLLTAAPGVKYRAALGVAYGAGLRVSEVVALKISDIDRERMLLRVEQGKGQRDRFVTLSPQLLELLRDWRQVAQPRGWLFPGLDPVNPMSARQLFRAVSAAGAGGGIAKRVSPHTLRHNAECRIIPSGGPDGVEIRASL